MINSLNNESIRVLFRHRRQLSTRSRTGIYNSVLLRLIVGDLYSTCPKDISHKTQHLTQSGGCSVKLIHAP